MKQLNNVFLQADNKLDVLQSLMFHNKSCTIDSNTLVHSAYSSWPLSMPREMDGEASLCTCNWYFPACTQGLRRHQHKAYWDLLTLKKNSLLNVNAQSAVWRYPSISFRGLGGCTQATLRVICDLKYDQDICWMSSLVFIWWNWICLLNFGCDRDACWTWLIFDVLNVNVWNVHVECDVWP